MTDATEESRIATLPKWAREIIYRERRDKERAITARERTLTIWSKAFPESPEDGMPGLYIEQHFAHGAAFRKLQDGAEIIAVASKLESFRIRLRRRGGFDVPVIEVEAGWGLARKQLAISPNASNVVTLRMVDPPA